MLKRYTLRTTLILVMSVLSLLLAGLGAWNLYTLSAANVRMQTLVQDSLLPMKQLGRVSQALDLGRYGLVSAIVDPLQIDRDMDALAATLKAGEADWAAYRQGALSPAERELAQRYETQWERLQRQGLGPAMEALRSVNLPGATELYSQNLLPLHAPARATLDELLALQQAQAQTLYEQSQSRYRLAMALSGGAALLGLGFAAVMGVLLVRAISRPLARAVRIAERVAEGDLSQRIAVGAVRNETGQLMQALAGMSDKLQAIVREVRAGTEQMAVASGQIAGGNADLSSRTEQQAGALQQTAAAMETLTQTVAQNAAHAAQADQQASAAAGVARDCGRRVEEVVQTMAAIQTASSRMADIIGVIDGIAFQTNLLALNAAVEAARAGEQGRGFAVVAAEVRGLARRSAEAAHQIRGLIQEATAEVSEGADLVRGAGQTMGEVVQGVQRVSHLVGAIASASAQQHRGLAEVGESLALLDRSTQQNAALVEEASAAAEALRQQAARLNRTVQRFQLGAAEAAP